MGNFLSGSGVGHFLPSILSIFLEKFSPAFLNHIYDLEGKSCLLWFAAVFVFQLVHLDKMRTSEIATVFTSVSTPTEQDIELLWNYRGVDCPGRCGGAAARHHFHFSHPSQSNPLIVPRHS